MVPQETDLLARLLDVVRAPVLVADLKGRVLVVNPAAEAVLGYRASEAADRLHVTDVYHRPEEARRVLRALRARDVDAGPGLFEVMLRTRHGELVPVGLSAALLRDRTGAEVGTLGVFEDRRERIALGLRLEEAAVQVEASERRAAELVTVTRAAHEMSQPLTAAMGNVEMLLLDPALPPAVLHRLERVYDQLERLKTAVVQLADMARHAGEGPR